jgi:transcriptional regulator with XRE-family HTH domain
MDFLERIDFLTQKKGITRNKLLTDLKLNRSSYTNWKQRGTIPNGETLSKIAKYLGVTTDYLLGVSDEQRPPELTKDILDGIISEQKRWEIRYVNNVPNEFVVDGQVYNLADFPVEKDLVHNFLDYVHKTISEKQRQKDGEAK